MPGLVLVLVTVPVPAAAVATLAATTGALALSGTYDDPWFVLIRLEPRR